MRSFTTFLTDQFKSQLKDPSIPVTVMLEQDDIIVLVGERLYINILEPGPQYCFVSDIDAIEFK